MQKEELVFQENGRQYISKPETSLGQAMGERVNSEGGRRDFLKHDFISLVGTQLYPSLLGETTFQKQDYEVQQKEAE